MNPKWRSIWRRIIMSVRSRGEAAVKVPHAPDQGRRALEARIALGRSRIMLNRVDSNEDRVERLHQSMQRLGEENGFAAMILRSLGGGNR